MPPRVFLAIPWLGCLLTLAFVATELLRRGLNAWESFAGVVVFGASAWLFTSTGWLSYMDSWVILGLLILTLNRSWPLVVAAALLTGWVDERFVAALPVAIATRWVLLSDDQDLRWSRRQWAVLMGCIGSFLLVRTALPLVASSSQVNEYLSASPKPLETPAKVWALGLWMGARGGWVFIAAFYVLACRRLNRAKALGLIAATMVPVVIAMVLVFDIDRSAALVAPMVVGGAVLVAAVSRSTFRKLLLVAFGLAVATPAMHVISNFLAPIHTVYYEVRRLKEPTPPAEELFVNLALNTGKTNPAEASRAYDAAIRIQPRYFRGRLSRAAWNLSQGNLPAARADVEVAIEVDLTSANAHWMLAGIVLQQGDRAESIVAIRRAVELGGDAWPLKGAALRKLAELESAGPATQPSNNKSVPD